MKNPVLSNIRVSWVFFIKKKLTTDTMQFPILCTRYAIACNLNASIDPVLLSSDV